jgi:hypothetical protein
LEVGRKPVIEFGLLGFEVADREAPRGDGGVDSGGAILERPYREPYLAGDFLFEGGRSRR